MSEALSRPPTKPVMWPLGQSARPAALSRNRPYSFDEFCRLVPDGQKADLLDGAIYMASPDNLNANRINTWLASLMCLVAEEGNLGTVLISRVAVRIDNRNGPEPDILFVRQSRAGILRRTYVDGPPDLVVEITSPESTDRDYQVKRRLYQRAGVREYWILDEAEQSVLLLRRNRAGEYAEVRPRGGWLRSTAMRGFRFRPEWMDAERRPTLLAALAELSRD